MNVFVIRSPYCYVNAIEFKKKYNLANEACVLLIGYRVLESIDIKHFEKIVDQNEWFRVSYFPQNATVAYQEELLQTNDALQFPGTKLLFLKKYVSRINTILPDKAGVEKVILQNIDEYSFLHIANHLNPEHVYCLDEGPRSLCTTDRRKISYGHGKLMQFAQNAKRLVMRLIFGYQVLPQKKTTFFSCYDLNHQSTESLIRNSYEYLRSKAVQLSREDDLVYFIGSSLSEVGVVSESFYLESLEKVKSEYPDHRIVYIAHRADCQKKLKIIEQELGIPVINFDIPFELQLAIVGPVPSTIISFYSSVLINSHTMLGDVVEVVSYRIPEEEIGDRYKEEINTIYAYFADLDSDSFNLRYLEQ